VSPRRSPERRACASQRISPRASSTATAVEPGQARIHGGLARNALPGNDRRGTLMTAIGQTGLHNNFTSSAHAVGMGDTPTRSSTAEVPGVVERVFAPIQSRTWAAAVARDLGKALVAVAVVEAALAGLRSPVALLPAALYAVAGALLWLTPTRLGALLALLNAAVSLTTTLVLVLAPTPASGGSRILVDFVALWIAGRALVATLAFRRFGRTGGAAADDDLAPISPGKPPDRAP
jgi:hypothetical protein